jgi:hypothetical protein
MRTCQTRPYNAARSHYTEDMKDEKNFRWSAFLTPYTSKSAICGFSGMDLQNILFRFSCLNLSFNSLNYDVCVCVCVCLLVEFLYN